MNSRLLLAAVLLCSSCVHHKAEAERRVAARVRVAAEGIGCEQALTEVGGLVEEMQPVMRADMERFKSIPPYPTHQQQRHDPACVARYREAFDFWAGHMAETIEMSSRLEVAAAVSEAACENRRP